MEPRKRCAIYGRVSTKDQTTESQLGPVRQYVDRQGWSLIGEYLDTATGAKERRPGLDRLVADVRAGRVDVVVTFKLDRLGRSLMHLVTLLDEWRRLGVEFVSVTQGFDTNTSAGKLMLGLLAVFAEFERELIRERVKAGVDRARAAGKRFGRPEVHVDEERLRELREVRRLSWRSIARALGAPARTLRRRYQSLVGRGKSGAQVG